MIGFAIALLILAWDVVLCNSELQAGLHDALTFLWYWGCVWYTFIFLLMTGLCTGAGTALASDRNSKYFLLGGIFGTGGGIILSSLILILPACLHFGGLYIMYHADKPFDVQFIIGAIMYVITIFRKITLKYKAD